jgi:hypothetical protein
MGKLDKVDRQPETTVGRKVLLSGVSFYLYRSDNNALVQQFPPADVATGKLTLTNLDDRSTNTA